MMKTVLIIALGLVMTVGIRNAVSQTSGTVVMSVDIIPARHEIALPDIPGYKTLKCDLHTHTMFSDGGVWPTVRVDNAWEDGLDAIAITDHIEYRPHAQDLKSDFNRPYEIALPGAKEKNIILIKGGEITRGMPPGHFNALFLKDVNVLDKPDYMDALRDAVNQGAFIQWNHPGWLAQQPDTTRWMKCHEEIYRQGWMHGIEVFNDKEFYPEVIAWSQSKHLAITANSDFHDNNYYKKQFPIRPITLAFATERTGEALREAMFAGRTAALFFDKLVGPKEWVEPLVLQSIQVSKPFLYQDGYAFFEVKNTSDIEFTLIKTGKDDSGLPEKTILPRKSTVVAKVKQQAGQSRTYSFKFENVLTGTEKPMEFILNIN